MKKKPVKKKAVKKKAVKKKAVKKKAVKKESSISLQITSPKIRSGGEFEDEVENYLRKKFGVDISVSSNSYEHASDDCVDVMTDVNIHFSPIPKHKSFEKMEEGDELYTHRPKWLDEVDNIISKENPDYEALTTYILECER